MVRVPIRLIHSRPATVLVCLLACGTARTETARSGSLSGPATSAGACTIREIGRSYLSLTEGRDVYVEPQALFETGRGRYLLAGAPTYEWVVDPSGIITRMSAAHFVGVEVSEGGVSPIPMPPGLSRVAGLKATLLGDDRVAFILEEGDFRPSDEESLGIFYGVYDRRARSWSPLESLPWPEGENGAVGLSSDVVAGPAGEPVYWAALSSLPVGNNAVVFERGAGAWSVSTVDGPWVEDVQITTGVAGDPIVAVAGLDADYEARLASVRLFRRGKAGWSPDPVEVGVPGGHFREPVFAQRGSDLTLAWLTEVSSGSEAHVLRDPLSTDGRLPSVLADGMIALHHVRERDGSMLWLAQRVSGITQSAVLDIYRDGGDGPRFVGSIPYPFLGYFAAISTEPGHLMIVGPDAQVAVFTPSVRSLAIRLSISCA